MKDWLKDPEAIYAASFAAIRASARLERLDADIRPLAERMIHACGLTGLVPRLRHSPGAAAAGREALAAGAPVICDCAMVAAGVIRGRLPAGHAVLMTLNDPGVAERAAAAGTTRSAMAAELWVPHLAGAIVAIGNAPTALYRLLQGLDEGWPRPALILGFPVGFIGAAASKAELARNPRGAGFVTLAGRFGGSALAAAAVNALGPGPGRP